MTLHAIVSTLLQQDDRFVSEDGILLKNTIREQANKLDKKLISLLLENDVTREKFFIPINDVLVFDINKFSSFINNKEFLPDSYTSFKNKIGLTTTQWEFIASSNEVVLSFPFKDCVLAWWQDKEDAKRDEIFYNEILWSDDIDRLLDKKVFTNFKKIDNNWEHKLDSFTRDEDGTIKDNLIIKWNNLLALHSLKSNFAWKVKLIYIDPPYNTGNDGFQYNDRFNHSTWLTFMKNRLEIARELLRDDGVIVVSIDNNEQAYLKILMDEIFGRENFLSNFIWETTKWAQWIIRKNMFVDNHENLVIFSKNINNFTFTWLDRDWEDFSNPDNDKRWPWKRQYLQRFWQWFSVKTIINPENWMKFSFETPYTEEKMNNWIKEWIIIFPKDPNKYPARKEYLNEYKTKKQITSSLWLFSTKANTEELYKIFDWKKIFSNPKPEPLIQFIIEQSTKNWDIILDYHLWSGTTCAVAHKLWRQYIGIEQMDYIETISVERMKKVIAWEQGGISKSVNWQGGWEFVYMELMEENHRILSTINKAKTIAELQQIYENIKNNEFINYNINPEKLDISNSAEADFEDFKNFLLEIIDKNLLYKNFSEMNDKNSEVNAHDKDLNNNFYTH